MSLPRPFTLQPLLNLRERREEQLQAELATCLADEEQQRQALAALEERHTTALHALGDVTAGRLDLTAVDAALTYLEAIAQRMHSQAEVSAAAEATTAAARSALTTAMQDRKVLEELRERQALALQHYLRRLETDQADEAALARYQRQSQGA